MENDEKNKCRIYKNSKTSQEHAVTKLDHTLSDEHLMMVKEPPMPSVEPDLPKGYRYAKPNEELIGQWQQALVDLDFVQTMEEAQFQWKRMTMVDEPFLWKHLYLVVDQKGELACTTGIWFYTGAKQGMRLHWVFTTPKHQKRGLARIIVQKASYEFGKEFPGQPLYLSTQASSWPAIVLYEQEGFKPLTVDNASSQAWKKAKKQVFEKSGVKI